MATSIAAGSGKLNFKERVCWGQGCRQTSWVSGQVGCPSSCKSRDVTHPLLQLMQIQSPLRTVTASYLRDGSTKYFDFSVIGSGVAGLRYALEVAKHGTVAVITKAEPHESNTNYAQGGVSAVLCPSDSVENHMQDTIVAGAYLCDEETVRVVCTEGPDRIRELIAMGASFDHGEDGTCILQGKGVTHITE
ncbi:hypothetical protein HYC85_002906 [Camellia sinensis]|uniref:FAD-dependent oxidoreductase 2 FAD-binding domain-containing protein n=1 Tax=Camellia sinensis TaxID=4442 RepID=A0A7J7IAT3_CAMSI|nr:hypothetical protein HYC85_002906 [Camellia sinensis]